MILCATLTLFPASFVMLYSFRWTLSPVELQKAQREAEEAEEEELELRPSTTKVLMLLVNFIFAYSLSYLHDVGIARMSF